MKLNQLLQYEHIAIQCHDNPDADSIAAGYGLHRYFASMGKKAVLFYSGRNQIIKPNLVRMIELFKIPLAYYPETKSWPGLLVTVDCQYGAGNVSRMEAQAVAVIDHHIVERVLPELNIVKPHLGSCSTLVWSMLHEEGYFSCDSVPSQEHTLLNTALYYGLFMDTSALSEVRHPLDRDLRDSPVLDHNILRTLQYSNLSLNDLTLASTALQTMEFNRSGRFALVHVKPCDPNLIGFISDLAIQVDTVDVAIVHSSVPGGIKYSVRTVVREAKASDIAAWMADGGLGSSGGHADKAGGWISEHSFNMAYPNLSISEYFSRRMLDYHFTFDLLDSNAIAPSCRSHAYTSQAEVYQKLPCKLAFVPPSAFAGQSSVHIRTLEGDIHLEPGPDTYLLIGHRSKVYPMSARVFNENYTPTKGQVTLSYLYPPSLIDPESGKRTPLENIAIPCLVRSGGSIMAKQLTRPLKLFTRWDKNNYVIGNVGDWLTWPKNDVSDLYIVPQDSFNARHKKLSLPEQSGSDADVLVNYSFTELSSILGSREVKKKTFLVYVRFAAEPGIAETREGPMPFKKGDALMFSAKGRIWPVDYNHFKEIYVPQKGLRMGQDGIYTAKRITATALEADTPFCVKLYNDTLVCGEPGDWILQYAPGEYRIINGDIIDLAYEI